MNNEDKILQLLNQIQTEQQQTNKRLDALEQKLDAVTVQQGENTDYIKALVHASEVHKAEIDNVTHTLARIEGTVKTSSEKIEKLSSDFNLIEQATAYNWREITILKAAK